MSTAVRSRVFKISAAAVTAAIAIGLCLFSQDDVSASIKERRVGGSTPRSRTSIPTNTSR